MKKGPKLILFGILIWLIPFALSIFFYNEKGELQIDKFQFKQIMIVVVSLTTNFLAYKYFKVVKKQYILEGFQSGIIWALINWSLDLLVLVKLMGMDVNDYMREIFTGYLIFPMTTITIGFALNYLNNKKDSTINNSKIKQY